jgi:hypothetical protein
MAKIIVIVTNEDYFDELFLFFFYMYALCQECNKTGDLRYLI